jgi:3-dehydroquinate synthetase
MMEADVSREALLLAVGGGVTTDLAGFVAGIYKRGIRYANLPTTLLSQVDAAIGGKTGVNLDGYKNELGVFHMPAFTFLCPEPLQTLPKREFRCGVAEMLKTFLIADTAAYRQAIDLLSGTKMADWVSGPGKTGPSSTKMADWVLRAAEIKAAIVQEDPYDRGNRQKLNLGHTFAHALEAVQAIRADAAPLKHGEAVAVGMVLAAQLAERLGIAQTGLTEQLKADFKTVGLPTDPPVASGDFLDAMRKDKKAASGKIRLVLPVKPGEVCIRELPLEDISAAF